MHRPFQSCARRLGEVLWIVDKGEVDMSVNEIDEEVCRVEDLSYRMSSRLISAYK